MLDCEIILNMILNRIEFERIAQRLDAMIAIITLGRITNEFVKLLDKSGCFKFHESY